MPVRMRLRAWAWSQAACPFTPVAAKRGHQRFCGSQDQGAARIARAPYSDSRAGTFAALVAAHAAHADASLRAFLGAHGTTRPARMSSSHPSIAFISSASARMSIVSTTLHGRGRTDPAPVRFAPLPPPAPGAPFVTGTPGAPAAPYNMFRRPLNAGPGGGQGVGGPPPGRRSPRAACAVERAAARPRAVAPCYDRPASSRARRRA